MTKTLQETSTDLAKPRRVHWRNRWVALEDCKTWEPQFPEMILKKRGDVWFAQTKHTCPVRAEQSAKRHMELGTTDGRPPKIVYVGTVMFDDE